jgi:hypothetical protein
MATQASLDLVQYAYIAFYGRPADLAGQEYWAEQLDTNGGDLAGIIDAFSNSPEYDAQYGDLTNEELVAALYQQILGREADAEGLAYYVGELESGARTKGAIALDILNGPLNNPEAAPEDAATLANRKAVADQFTALVESEGKEYGEDQLTAAKNLLSAVSSTTDTDNVNVAGTVNSFPAAQEGTGPSVEGETFDLTDGREGSGRDVLTGTDGDDTFVGLVGQNSEGAVANAFSTGDWIDGGAGRDTVKASLINDNEVGEAPSNNQAPRPITENVEEVYIEALEAVTLDATRMEGVEEFWSDFSRGDMTFTGVNLRGDNVDITKDVTFGIKDTMHDTDFTALFDSLSLTREASNPSNSQLLVRIADVSTETPDAPLTNVNLNLSFNLGGTTISLEDVQSTDGSYAGLVEAIQNALALEGYAGLTVELSTPYNQVTFANNTVNLPFTAQEILITDPAGNNFANVNFTQSAIQPVAGGFLVAGNAQPVDPSETSNLIESNLVLDNAGNGSLAGDVVIGAMSNSDKGVERFNVMVDRDSRIESLNTTNDKLQEIHISSLDAAGDLWIGGTQSDLDEIDANAFTGENLSLGQGSTTFGGANDPISDLTFLDASGTAADITFVADYDGNGRASNQQAFVINTGSGDDSITADLTGRSTSGSTEATLAVTSTGGNNTVTLTSDNVFNNEATVVLGAGSDTVTGGSTNLTANTGAGNDVIYAENTGQKAQGTLNAGAWQTTAGTTAMSGNNVLKSQLLYGQTVQVTLALPGVAHNFAADSFAEGLEATAEIVASNGFLTTERDLYEAVARAINEDPVLSELAEAEVDSNGHLTVKYLIDGETVLGDDFVQIELLNDATDLTQAEIDNIAAALREEYSDSDINVTNTNDVTTGYTAAAAVVDVVETAGAVAGQVAVYQVTLQDLTVATSGVPENVTYAFQIDGIDVSLTLSIDPGAGDTTQAATEQAAQLAGQTVTANGVTYTIADAGAGAITLTGNIQTDDNNGGIIVQATNVNAFTFTAAAAAPVQAGVDPVGAGTNSNTVGDNTVNAGAGDDVIVLSSSTVLSQTDTVVFDRDNIGNDTIVHFDAGANGDVLDFTAWLTNVSSASGSEESQVRVATSVVTATNIVNNSVTIVDFDTVETGFGTGTIAFDTLSNDQLLAALNGTATGGNAATFAAAAGNAQLVGNDMYSIILIERDGNSGTPADNFGEYLVAQVQSDAAGGNAAFESVTIIGSIDLAQTETGVLTAANFA